MNTQENNAVAYNNMFLLMTAMPGVKLDDRKGLVETAMAVKGFDEETFRLNIDLSDEALMMTHQHAEGGQRGRDWWIKEHRMGGRIAITLDLEVHFEDDTQTKRVIGLDASTSRILTVDGKVYQLGRRLVAPIEVSHTEAPRRLVVDAERLASDNGLAKKYVDRRHSEAMQFFKSLKWEPCPSRGFSVVTHVYGVEIVHEMAERQLHATPFWGELFFLDKSDRDPIVFQTFENFVAYMLAKYW